MYFDRFDICEAYYVFAMLWHGGQFSKEYEIFGRLERMKFRPPPMLSGPEDLGENAREIYDRLVQRNIFVRYFDLPGLADKLRITVGTTEQNEKLILALKEILP